MTLLEKMNQDTSFSESEQSVVNYLLEHMNEIEQMTLEQLARKSSRFLRFYQMIKDHGAAIITFTANEKHIIAQKSRHKVIVAHREQSHKIATFYSQFVFDYLLNILYSMIYAHDYERMQDHKKRVDQLNH